MRKIMIHGNIFALLMLLVLLLGACDDKTEKAGSDNNNDNKKIVLRTSSAFNPKHLWHIGMLQPWMDRVENETNGGITFELFGSGELVQFGNEYEALRQGTIDLTLSLPGLYDPQRFPYTEAVLLPLLKTDSQIGSTAMFNLMKSEKILAEGKTFYELEFEDNNLVAFANSLTEPYLISSTKTEFSSINDFSKSFRLRTASRIHENFADNLNVTSVSIPITDSYDALNRNALDGLLYNVIDWNSMGFDELLKHTILGADIGHGSIHIAMMKETWDKIPDEYKEIMQEAAEEIIFEAAQFQVEQIEPAKETYTSLGGQFINVEELDPTVQEHISKAIVKTWFDWIESVEAEGHAGKEMAILWRDLIVEAGGEVPQEIMNLE